MNLQRTSLKSKSSLNLLGVLQFSCPNSKKFATHHSIRVRFWVRFRVRIRIGVRIRVRVKVRVKVTGTGKVG